MLRTALLLFALVTPHAAAQSADRTVVIRAETVSPLNIRPIFDNGYLVVWETKGFSVYAPDGAFAFRVVRPEGDAMSAFAVDVDGTVAAAIFDQQRPGIVVIDSHGKEKRFIETGAFLPSRVCFAPDHSIWTVGAVPGNRGQPAPEYSLLRHFSPEGALLGEFLPRSSFGNGEGGLAMTAGLYLLRVANGRIGAYLSFQGPPKSALWVEIGLDGKELGRWSADQAGRSVVFTPGGDVYSETNAGIVKLDRSTRQWNPVFMPAHRLIGATNDSLVFLAPGETVLRYVDSR